MATRDLTHAGISPFTGFGDDPNTSIKFGIRRVGRDGGEADWDGGEPKLSTFAVHNSSDLVTQYHGRGPREITLRLWFASIDDLEALDAVQGRQATLRYLWGITSRAGGTKETRGDRSYLVLPETTLARLTDRTVFVDGSAEATATFRRAVNTSDLYGYALYTEE